MRNARPSPTSSRSTTSAGAIRPSATSAQLTSSADGTSPASHPHQFTAVTQLVSLPPGPPSVPGWEALSHRTQSVIDYYYEHRSTRPRDRIRPRWSAEARLRTLAALVAVLVAEPCSGTKPSSGATDVRECTPDSSREDIWSTPGGVNRRWCPYRGLDLTPTCEPEM